MTSILSKHLPYFLYFRKYENMSPYFLYMFHIFVRGEIWYREGVYIKHNIPIVQHSSMRMLEHLIWIFFRCQSVAAPRCKLHQIDSERKSNYVHSSRLISKCLITCMLCIEGSTLKHLCIRLYLLFNKYSVCQVKKKHS